MSKLISLVFILLTSLNSIAGPSPLKNYIVGKPMGGFDGGFNPLTEGCISVLENLNGKEFQVLFEDEDNCFFTSRFNSLALQDVVVGLNNSTKRAQVIKNKSLRSTLIDSAKSILQSAKIPSEGKTFKTYEILD